MPRVTTSVTSLHAPASTKRQGTTECPGRHERRFVRQGVVCVLAMCDDVKTSFSPKESANEKDIDAADVVATI
jgi:hypothetical protein